MMDDSAVDCVEILGHQADRRCGIVEISGPLQSRQYAMPTSVQPQEENDDFTPDFIR
jgi:hypothetical protein